jgi:carboxyvinyl-carboxyphosphonate phosphorylmutase
MADAVVIANRANIFWGENKMQWTAQRDRLRAILNGSECIRPASVFDPLSARIAEDLGFELGLFAGSTASLTVLGAPDLVLLTASEFAQQAQRVCRATNIPVLVDADHGYGNALNVARTVEELATIGIAAATIEDTILPTPFGAGGKPGLISLEEGVGKMRAALAGRPDPAFAIVGRTSAPVISSLADTIERLRAYERAGVDALFIVGLKTIAELSEVADKTTLPLILGSASGEIESADLSALRVRICNQGHLPIMAAVQSIYDTMKALRGGTRPAEIKNVASGALMKTLTRAAQYDEATRDYLTAK